MKRLPRLTEVFRLREADLDIDRFARRYAGSPVGNPDPMGSKQRDVSKVGPRGHGKISSGPGKRMSFSDFKKKDPQKAKSFEDEMEVFDDARGRPYDFNGVEVNLQDGKIEIFDSPTAKEPSWTWENGGWIYL